MIQPARSQNSKSLLRELEFSLVLIKDKTTREYFLHKLNEVFIRQNDPNSQKTGATKVKTELLTYLGTQGYLNTANVWARNLSLDRKNINNLLLELQTELLKNDIKGVLEIHLQDREINSPHIQFVGTNARVAEQVIAEILVKKGYETSIENALSKKNFKPYYLEDHRAYTANLGDKIEHFARERKTSVDEIYDLLEILDNTMQKEIATIKFDEIAQKSKDKFVERIKQTKIKIKTHNSMIDSVRSKQHLRKLHRKRRNKYL